jgi:fibronectin type 3 domain-containing protein
VKYYYFVRAYRRVNDEGFRLYSNYSQVVSGVSNLNTVQIFSLTANGYDSLKIRFSAIQGATGYEIYRGMKKNGTYKKIATTKNTSYLDKGLKTGVTYFYKVCAIREENGSVVRSEYSAPIWKSPKLSKVYGFYAISIQKKTTDISWSPVDGASGYIVYRCSKRDGTYTKAGQTTETTFVDRNRKSGTTYYYKARAYRYVNGKMKYGDWSGIKKVTVQ